MSKSRAYNQTAIKFLNKLRGRAVKDGIRATDAVKLLIDEVPNITRAEVYNSAEVAGINRLTARNIFDSIKGGK